MMTCDGREGLQEMGVCTEAGKVPVAVEQGRVIPSGSYSMGTWTEVGRQRDVPVWLQWTLCWGLRGHLAAWSQMVG